MKYQQPFDQPTNPNAAYINGNPSTGTPGSIPPASAFEEPQREIVNFITDSGITPSDADLHQISKSVQSGQVTGALDTGTANAMVAAFNPAITALMPFMSFRIKKGASASSGPTTLNVGTGAFAVKRADGSAIGAGDIPANTVGDFVWDGGQFQYSNFQAATSGGVTNNYNSVGIPYAVDSGTVNAVVAVFSPAITSMGGGDLYKVKLANSITGAATFKVNTLAAVNLVRPDGTALRSGDIVNGQELLLEFDGTNVQVISGLASTSAFAPGGIYMWPLATPPSGCVECNGFSYSTTGVMARLFALIGYEYGGAAGLFNVPNYRGMFLRGWDHGAGNDPDAASRTNRGDGTTGDNVGTKEAPAAGPISLTAAAIEIDNPLLNGVNQLYEVSGPSGGDMGISEGLSANASVTKITGTMAISGNSGSSETRPKNINVLYVIAY